MVQMDFHCASATLSLPTPYHRARMVSSTACDYFTPSLTASHGSVRHRPSHASMREQGSLISGPRASLECALGIMADAGCLARRLHRARMTLVVMVPSTAMPLGRMAVGRRVEHQEPHYSAQGNSKCRFHPRALSSSHSSIHARVAVSSSTIVRIALNQNHSQACGVNVMRHPLRRERWRLWHRQSYV
jgi:hypothetical protein